VETLTSDRHILLISDGQHAVTNVLSLLEKKTLLFGRIVEVEYSVEWIAERGQRFESTREVCYCGSYV
jgi:hypothetical protein